MDFLVVQRSLVTNQEEMKEEYANFVQMLSDYVNQEIANFKHNVVLLGDSVRDIRVYMTQVCEVA